MNPLGQRRAASSKCQAAMSAPAPALAALGLLLTVALAGRPASAQTGDSDAQLAAKASGLLCPASTVGQRAQQASKDPHQQQQDAAKKLFCFYDIQDDFRPQDINPCLCTHVIYSYVAVRRNLSFIAGKKGDLRSLASLKRRNPSLKLLVSFRPDDYFSFDLSPADAQTAAQDAAPQMNEMHHKFAKRIRDFVVRHSLDGVNLDWSYFAQTMSSPNASREHLQLVLAALNENLAPSSLHQAHVSPSAAYLRNQSPLVTLAASKDFYSLIDGYDFHRLSRLVDFVHLPAFDFDLNVDQFSIGHPARLHGISDTENLDTLVDLLLSSGLPSEQLIAGVPSHGVQITSRPSEARAVQPARLANGTTGAANNTLDEQLEAAAKISIVSHSEVCRVRDLVRSNCSLAADSNANSCWTLSRARDLTAPFAYDSEHWLGFDDETSVKLKAKYTLLRHLGGVALFTVNNDDPTGTCGFGPFPLLSTINGVLTRLPSPSSSAGAGQTALFTRSPNQLLTATSIVAHIFGRKQAGSEGQTTGDLLASASERSPENHRQAGAPLMSFVDIIEKYGAVNRLDSSALSAHATGEPVGADSLDQQLACERVGYQRYPRDCSRFYRCVQTPPTLNSSLAPAPALSRLQYECPSGLVFDEQYQICNWPSWSSQCTGSGEVNAITNAKFMCPNYGYFQNQENCEYFYYCSDYNRGQSQAYQFRCPFELGFDEEKLQCNWKWLVKGCNVTAPPADHHQRPRVSGETRDAISKRSMELPGAAEPAEERRINYAWISHFTSLADAIAALRERRVKKVAQQMAASAQPSRRPADETPVKYPSFVGAPQTTAKPASSTNKPSFRIRRRQGQSATGGPAAPATVGLSSGAGPARDPAPEGLPYKPRPPPPSRLPFLPSSAIYMFVDSIKSYSEAIQDELNRYMRVAGDRVRGILGVRGQSQGASAPAHHYGKRKVQQEQEQQKQQVAAGKEASNRLAELSRRIGPGSSLQVRRKRAKREVSADGDELVALESAVGAVGAAPALHRAPQMAGRIQKAPFVDPLGRPPGYPMNPLDEAAKAAVLGPEVKLYVQPSMLISNQMSGISQQEFERIVRSGREWANMHSGPPRRAADNQRHQNQRQMDSNSHMMSSSSVLSEQVVAAPPNFTPQQVVERIIERARPGFSLSHPPAHEPQMELSRPQTIPFGMPSSLRPVQTSPSPARLVTEQATGRDQTSPVEPKRRRSTVVMKLATMAMPKLAVPTRSPPQQQQQQQSQKEAAKSASPSRGYLSFLPSLSSVVRAPARSFLGKAMDLISTLAPGKGAEPKQPAPTSSLPVGTTPPMNQLKAQPSQHEHRPRQPVAQPVVGVAAGPSPERALQSGPAANRSLGQPLLLTEQEARALSAQLELMSNEQLEALSLELASGALDLRPEASRPAPSSLPLGQHHMERPRQLHRPQLEPSNQSASLNQSNEPPQDYVSKLLKVLIQTSHNPEDIKLLDHLASQLSNPQSSGADEPLIEVGQPDDLALLEALGLVPRGSAAAALARSKYSLVGQPLAAHQQQAASEAGGPPIMPSAGMRGLIPAAEASLAPLSDEPTSTMFVPVRLELAEPQPTPPSSREPPSSTPAPPRSSGAPDWQPADRPYSTRAPDSSSAPERSSTQRPALQLASESSQQDSFSTETPFESNVTLIADETLVPGQTRTMHEPSDGSPHATDAPRLLDTAHRDSTDSPKPVHQPPTSDAPTEARTESVAVPRVRTSIERAKNEGPELGERRVRVYIDRAPSFGQKRLDSEAGSSARQLKVRRKKVGENGGSLESTPTATSTTTSASVTPLEMSGPTEPTRSDVTRKPAEGDGSSPVKPDEGVESKSKRKRKSRTSKKVANKWLPGGRAPPPQLPSGDKHWTSKTGERERGDQLEASASSSQAPTGSHGTKSGWQAETLRPFLSDASERVAIYGTKSGFIPILGPDDPSYLETRFGDQERPRQAAVRASDESLASSDSFITSKRQRAPDRMLALLPAADRERVEEPRSQESSWRMFASRLSEQISVVKLGNLSEPNQAGLSIQARLIILPASPNDRLLEPANWNFLSAQYPQLFPPDLSRLDVGPIDLGPASISTAGGFIDEQRETSRLLTFKRHFPDIGRLIEERTFKALDEIVQRSGGRLFMMRRPDEASKTVIAVIPDKPLIRQQRPAKSAGPLADYYQRQLHVQSTGGAQISQTTSGEAARKQDEPTRARGPAQVDGQSPQRAAAFSRAIQNSIQEAIISHFDAMKNQLGQSMTGTPLADQPPASTAASSSAGATSEPTRVWSTPAPESLAKMESANADPLDVASSSTEYSLATEEASSEQFTRINRTDKRPAAEFSSHAVLEVDGAEPKSLYGLELSSHQTDQRLYFSGIRERKEKASLPVEMATVSPSKPSSTARHASRFISIRSHLIATPQKMPKIVDQAYVNHFYDHISEHQLAKAVGFDEPSDTKRPSATNGTAEFESSVSENGSTGPTTSLGEDSLVPESACTRAGLFLHPFACNKFYECFWDKQLNKYTLHMFECPIKLAFDDRIVGCAMPIESSLCVNY